MVGFRLIIRHVDHWIERRGTLVSVFGTIVRIGIAKGVLNWLPDRPYIKLVYRVQMGRALNLDSPMRYSEKIQWLKLYDRRPEYSIMVDKADAKQWISKIVGDQYVIPTVGVWDKFDQIDFTQLPNQFVLKCTHDSGGVVICRDKQHFDYQAAKTKLQRSLRRSYYLRWREWPYKHVKPRIIAEPYLEDSKTGELRDHKILTFHGEPKIFYITSGRKVGDRRTVFFDMELQHLDLRDDDDNAELPPEIPSSIGTMLSLASELSRNTPHLRVDFYEIDGKPYVGELTLYYLSGYAPFDPDAWDSIFGSWIDLSEVAKTEVIGK